MKKKTKIRFLSGSLTFGLVFFFFFWIWQRQIHLYSLPLRRRWLIFSLSGLHRSVFLAEETLGRRGGFLHMAKKFIATSSKSRRGSSTYSRSCPLVLSPETKFTKLKPRGQQLDWSRSSLVKSRDRGVKKKKKKKIGQTGVFRS